MNELLIELISSLESKRQAYEKWNRDNIGKPRRSMAIDYVDAVFWSGKRRKTEVGRLPAIQALDCLAQDVHRFADFDLHDADSVTIESPYK